MSRLFAKRFKSSRSIAGKRIEIVCVEGLSRPNVTRWALLQSTYSVESWADQNACSWASFLNWGIGFCGFFFGMLIYLSLPPTHGTGRDHTDEILPDGKHNEEEPACVSLPKRIISPP